MVNMAGCTQDSWAVRRQEDCGGAHSFAGVAPDAPMWTNIPQSCVQNTDLLEHSALLHLIISPGAFDCRKLLFLGWFKAFLVGNYQVFCVIDSSLNPIPLFLSWLSFH